ncbi:MAG: lipoprotein [Hydrogenophaga sp.]|uniref:LPS translocon maturation chaperone LptM n=1 Tax=Hydrogenophaga sp. TaxID=1904254 RepID=UPI0027E74864|nr:lipoprotein [Hydrogenophaga sp.]
MLKKPILGGLFSRPTVGSGVALLATALMASGCGQKGPLFMPSPASTATPKPSAAPAPAEQPAAGAPTDTTQPAGSGTAR